MIVSMNGTAIAASKACTVVVKTEKIPVSSNSQGQWEHCIAGRKSWTVSCSTLLTNISTPASMVGQTVTLTITTDTGGSLTGSALVTQWEGSGAVGSLGQGSYNFAGNGQLA